LGVFALLGIFLAQQWPLLGIILSGGCAFIIANLIPIFKWDSIVSGFKEVEKDWTRIYKGYEEILSFYEISNKDEILSREYQRVKEMHNAAALNDQKLPKDAILLEKCQKEVMEYRGIASNKNVILPLDNPKK
jgi:hypothetical protein